MHQSADHLGRLFFALYWRPEFQRILDIGSLDVNGTLRRHCPTDADYIGIDLSSGPGVDVVLNDAHNFPFPDDYFDAIVSSSCFEHDQMFWITFIEAIRVLSKQGFLYINAPSNGLYHPYPVDNWRFYPDAGLALEQWARRSQAPVQLVESFIAGRTGGESSTVLGDMWNDCVMVFGKSDFTTPPRLICDAISVRYNVRRAEASGIVNESELPEDMRIIISQRHEIDELKQLVNQATLKSDSALARLTIYCVAYQRCDTIPILIHSLMCQTFRDFHLVVVHDGEDNRMRELLSALCLRYPDKLSFIFSKHRFNDHGHSLRQIGIDICRSEFYMSTNDDNYYVPKFLEEMFSKIDADNLDVVLCDMIHNYDFSPWGGSSSYNPFITEPRMWKVDIGCFIVKTEIAKRVGFRDKGGSGDGTFIEDIMNNSGRPVKWGKVDKVLFVHN
jgi:Glycosyl transferase family 2/Methyltransferase domain